MDFATRDRYRHVVEAIARASPMSESDVARKAIQLAHDAAGGPHATDGDHDPSAHVGCYLIGEGRRAAGTRGRRACDAARRAAPRRAPHPARALRGLDRDVHDRDDDQAVHEADGGDDPAEEGRGGEPGKVLAPQTIPLHLWSGWPGFSPQSIERQAKKGRYVRRPAQDHGRNVRHEDLGDSRANPESNCRDEDIKIGLFYSFRYHFHFPSSSESPLQLFWPDVSSNWECILLLQPCHTVFIFIGKRRTKVQQEVIRQGHGEVKFIAINLP